MLGLIARPYAATVAATTGAFEESFPATNALNNDYGRVAKFAGASGIVLDLGSAKEVDVAAVLWHNIDGGNVQVRAGSTAGNAQTGASYAAQVDAVTGATRRDPAPRLSKTLITFTAVTARYWYLAFSAGSQVSRVLVGKKAVFAIGPQKATISARDLNQTVQLESGEERGSEDPELIRPIASLDLEYATESEMADVLGGYTLGLGTSRPMLLTPDATGAYLQDTLVFGKPERVISVESDVHDVWRFNATVPSIGP